MSSVNDPYILRKIRYFNAYNLQTKELEFCKFNFNFTKYIREFGLINKSKLEVFDDFLQRNGWSHYLPTRVKQEFKQYFNPITSSMKTYNEYIGFSIHPGYTNPFNLNSYIPYEILVENQFELSYYTDNQVRRLQDYYFHASNDEIYTKYNFNFDLFSKDFNVYGNNLIVFTDFISRVIYESDTKIGTEGYGNPKSFSKYFTK